MNKINPVRVLSPDRVDSRISCFGFVFSDLFGLGCSINESLMIIIDSLTSYVWGNRGCDNGKTIPYPMCIKFWGSAMYSYWQ